MWYVVQTQASAEDKAEFHLKRQGFATYLPRFRKTVRHARRVREAIRPLFPRYLFVWIDVTAQQWRSIASTVGVATLVTAGDRPLPVPDEIIDDIRRREDSAGFIDLPPEPGFEPGQQVVVERAGLRGQVGLFQGMKDDQRVFVLLEILGRQVKACVPAVDVRAFA
ncbi:MAG: transcriptional activator RfaH [Rhodospirillales bacterium]